MTFREFLDKKAVEEQQPARRERRQEWVAAVERLFDQLRTWLTESDPDRVLDILVIPVEKWEPALGGYRIPSLRIAIGESAVQVVPVGRDALGVLNLQGSNGTRAQGRVDITDGVRKYILYRLVQEGKDSWQILDEDFQPQPLDRSRLETALQDLLA